MLLAGVMTLSALPVSAVTPAVNTGLAEVGGTSSAATNVAINEANDWHTISVGAQTGANDAGFANASYVTNALSIFALNSEAVNAHAGTSNALMGGLPWSVIDLQTQLSHQNYRTLTMTPGANATQMRWTWHSRSAESGITINAADGTALIRASVTGGVTTGFIAETVTVGGLTLTVNRRPLGYQIGLRNALDANDPASRAEFGGIHSNHANQLRTVGGVSRTTQLMPHNQSTQQSEIVAGRNDGMEYNRGRGWFTYDTEGLYWVYQAEVTGLATGTSYTYQITGVGTNAQVRAGAAATAWTSVSYDFRTAGGDVLRFTAGGDAQLAIWGAFSGTGQGTYSDDYRGWANAVNVMSNYQGGANLPISFFMPVGDQVDHNNNQARRSMFWHDALVAPPAFRNIPIMPVVGNHEAAGQNGHLWPFIYNTPAGNHPSHTHSASNVRAHNVNAYQFDYYSVQGDMLLIQLDGNSRNWSAGRLGWFENVIQENGTNRWIVVTFHHPPYSVYRDTNLGEKVQIIQNWIPEFERLGVDVVINGHCHVYSRTHQMFQNRPVFNQTWVVGTSGTTTRTGYAQGSAAQTPSSVVVAPTGIVYFALNSMSGSGYRNVRNLGGRDYIATHNQNFRRNFTVVDVTPYSLAVHTYQVNDDGITTDLVDTYTIVRNVAGGNMSTAALIAAARVADPHGLRQLVEDINTNVIPVHVPGEITIPTPAVNTAAGRLAAARAALPDFVMIETAWNNNQGGAWCTNGGCCNRAMFGNDGGFDALGIQGIQAIRSEMNVYTVRVRPIWVPVTWNAAGAVDDNARTVFTATPDFNNVLTTPNTEEQFRYRILDTHENLGGGPSPNYGIRNYVHWQGSPAHQMAWMNGSFRFAAGTAPQIPVNIGVVAPANTAQTFTLSSMGSTSFHYRPAASGTAFIDDAFNINEFTSWPLVNSGVAFGFPNLGPLGYLDFRYNPNPELHRNVMLIPTHLTPVPSVPYRVGDEIRWTLVHRGSHTAPIAHTANQPQYRIPGREIDENATFHYFSRAFTLPADFDPARIGQVFGNHRIDDNLILFINGVEIYRYNTSTNAAEVRIGGPINWEGFNGHETRVRNRSFTINQDIDSRVMRYSRGMTTTAVGTYTEYDQMTIDAASRSNLIAALNPGVNILTAVVGNADAQGRDFWFDLDLRIEYLAVASTGAR